MLPDKKGYMLSGNKKRRYQERIRKVRSYKSSSEVARLSDQVKKAIDESDYKFRTFDGLANQLGVNRRKIYEVVKSNKGDYVILGRRSRSGQILLTTRKRYKKEATPKERIIGALLNRAY